MSDEKDIFSQIHEYHVLIDDLKNENIILPEAFVVRALVEKLLDLWKYYKKEQKHKRKQMNLEDVIIHIRIEEKNKEREKTERTKELTSKANLFENNLSRPKKYFYKPNFKSNQNPKMKRNPNSTFKKKGNCFVCGKPGHYSAQCSFQKTLERLYPNRKLA